MFIHFSQFSNISKTFPDEIKGPALYHFWNFKVSKSPKSKFRDNRQARTPTFETSRYRYFPKIKNLRLSHFRYCYIPNVSIFSLILSQVLWHTQKSMNERFDGSRKSGTPRPLVCRFPRMVFICSFSQY